MELDIALIGGQFIAGIERGMIYFLLATGLTLILGVLGIINFAHGTFYMVAMFLVVTLTRFVDYWLAFLFIPVIIALIGGVVEVLLLRRIYGVDPLLQILLTFALVYIASDVVRLIWGPWPLLVTTPSILEGSVNLGTITVPVSYAFMVAVGAGAGVGLWALLHKTKLGTIIRACSIDREMASALGLNVKILFTLVFMLGIWLAGVAAVAAAPSVSAELGMDMNMIVMCFAVVVIGGMGSIGGALIGALAIGLVESFGMLVFPRLIIALAFALMAVFLVVRPWGLLGKPTE